MAIQTDCVGKMGNIETTLSSIQSALNEQEGIISTSFDIFGSVLIADSVCDNAEKEKACEISSLGRILTTIRDCIVSNNNRLINLNSRSDL